MPKIMFKQKTIIIVIVFIGAILVGLSGFGLVEYYKEEYREQQKKQEQKEEAAKAAATAKPQLDFSNQPIFPPKGEIIEMTPNLIRIKTTDNKLFSGEITKETQLLQFKPREQEERLKEQKPGAPLPAPIKLVEASFKDFQQGDWVQLVNLNSNIANKEKFIVEKIIKQ